MICSNRLRRSTGHSGLGRAGCCYAMEGIHARRLLPHNSVTGALFESLFRLWKNLRAEESIRSWITVRITEHAGRVGHKQVTNVIPVRVVSRTLNLIGG